MAEKEPDTAASASNHTAVEAEAEVEEISTPGASKYNAEKAAEEKSAGNECFAKGQFEDAIQHYTAGLDVCPSDAQEYAPLLCNRGACHLKLEDFQSCIDDCTLALEAKPDYVKALLRRACAHESMDHLEKALEDLQTVLKHEPSNTVAREGVTRLPPRIKEQQEKLKEEMFSKLKDLGNMCLRPFGLSTDNFQVVQDQATGSYSINFVQNSGSSESTQEPESS